MAEKPRSSGPLSLIRTAVADQFTAKGSVRKASALKNPQEPVEPATGTQLDRTTHEHADDPEVELTRRIFDVVGDVRATEWMTSQVPSLSNRTPISLMGSTEGRAEVERVLGRIEHGIF